MWVLTISEKSEVFATEALQTLRNAGFRVSLDNSAEKVGAKIRNAQLAKIPYMLVIGEKEAAAASVSVRHSKKGDQGVKLLTEAIAQISGEIATKAL